MIRSGRIVTVRSLTRADVDEMCRWPKYTEPQFQWANFEPRSEFDKDVWFSCGTGVTSKRYAILDKENRLIGVVGLRNIDRLRGEATLGIRMSAAEVNQGYGTDAILTLLEHAFCSMRLRRVNLDVAEDNWRARRCYEKCGFKFVRRRLSFDKVVYIDMTISSEDACGSHIHRPGDPANDDQP